MATARTPPADRPRRCVADCVFAFLQRTDLTRASRHNQHRVNPRLRLIGGCGLRVGSGVNGGLNRMQRPVIRACGSIAGPKGDRDADCTRLHADCVGRSARRGCANCRRRASSAAETTMPAVPLRCFDVPSISCCWRQCPSAATPRRQQPGHLPSARRGASAPSSRTAPAS